MKLALLSMALMLTVNPDIVITRDLCGVYTEWSRYYDVGYTKILLITTFSISQSLANNSNDDS